MVAVSRGGVSGGAPAGWQRGAAPNASQRFAGAMIASALRIGSKIPSAFAFIDAYGFSHDMRETCPTVIIAQAARDLAAADAAASTKGQRLY